MHTFKLHESTIDDTAAACLSAMLEQENPVKRRPGRSKKTDSKVVSENKKGAASSPAPQPKTGNIKGRGAGGSKKQVTEEVVSPAKSEMDKIEVGIQIC